MCRDLGALAALFSLGAALVGCNFSWDPRWEPPPHSADAAMQASFVTEDAGAPADVAVPAAPMALPNPEAGKPLPQVSDETIWWCRDFCGVDLLDAGLPDADDDCVLGDSGLCVADTACLERCWYWQLMPVTN